MSNTSSSSQGLFFIRATVLAAVILGTVASLTAGAKAGDDKSGLRVAVVNPGKLLSEYKYAKTSRESLEKMDGDAKLAITTWRKYPLLTGQEQDTMVNLVIKENTPGVQLAKAELDQETALKTKHDALVKEYQDLLGKPNGTTTEQDANRMAAFAKLNTATETRVAGKQKDATTEITRKEEEYNVKIDKDVRDTLTKVAKEKGVNLVFTNQVVLFADVDLTDDVLRQLNK